jgi:hypothetical protein
MASQLTPCPSCSRHVKVGPPSCPFCGGAVPVDVPARPVLVGRPLSRAALMFAGAATVAACSSTASQPSYGVFVDAGIPNSDASERDGATVPHYGGFGNPGDASPLYGVHVNPDDAGPVMDATSTDSGVDADASAPVNMDAAYGVVILADTGTDASTDSRGDAFNPGGGSGDGGDPGNGGAAYGSFVNPP